MNNNQYLAHYGVLGMHWGKRKGDQTSSISARQSVEKVAYRVGAKLNPRELKYNLRKMVNNPNELSNTLSDYVATVVRDKGVLPTSKVALSAVETIGITKHAEKKYDNLNDADLEKLKTYTDSARYSRSINGYLAIGEPIAYAKEAQNLKNTLSKNSIDETTVYRSCSMKFSIDGVAKKFDNMSDDDIASQISGMSKNFAGKSRKENRIFSTSTSPLFAIDTWRAVNPTAAATYNTYMIIKCKGCPGVLADATTTKGKALVNTRSNQEAILAPNKLTYKKLEYDAERGMFAITVEAT